MIRTSNISAVVVIPARNEEQRLPACLQALAASRLPGVAVLIVANNCTDRTCEVAAATAEALLLPLQVLTCHLADHQGVGTARRLGCDAALATWPDAQMLLSTDADCIAGPDWIAKNLSHLSRYDAVCGVVTPIAQELSVLRDMDLVPARMEGQYERLVMAYYRLCQLDPNGLHGDHGHAAGASIALRTAAYRAAGGFADCATGEDRDLVRRLKLAGQRVLHAGDVTVTASCRLDGRARDGMSAALRARAARTDYLIDDALPPAHWLIAAAAHGTLGPWPLYVAASDRIHARALAPHIAALEQAMPATPRIICPPSIVYPDAALSRTTTLIQDG